jgi:hypothetical protein
LQLEPNPLHSPIKPKRSLFIDVRRYFLSAEQFDSVSAVPVG